MTQPEKFSVLVQSVPQSGIYFLAGSIPGSSFLHLRQLSLFGMITRLKDSTINKHAKNIFSNNTISQKSWFHQIRNLCLKYDLPHPSSLLLNPPSKQEYKRIVKKKIINYWELLLRDEASSLTSLEFFFPEKMSLTSPHPIWKTAGSSPTKVLMASVQSLMVSGRYRTQGLCSHWSNNTSGICKPSHSCGVFENLSHILQDCVAVCHTCTKLRSFTDSYCADKPVVQLIVQLYCTPGEPKFCQFLVDCSVLPEVVSAVQQYGQDILTQLYDISRIWCYALHRDRLKILGRWPDFKK